METLPTCIAANGGDTVAHSLDTLAVVLVALAVREVLKALMNGKGSSNGKGDS